MYTTNITSASSYQTAYNNNGYGGMVYYSSPTCGYPTAGSNTYVETGCTTDYAQSEVKYAVDAWAADKFQASDLKEDATGYSARLLTFEELTTNLGYTAPAKDVTSTSLNSETVPSFVYNSNYYYWTMSPFQDESLRVWSVIYNGDVIAYSASNYNVCGVVRPVVTLLKSAI